MRTSSVDFCRQKLLQAVTTAQRYGISYTIRQQAKISPTIKTELNGFNKGKHEV